MQSSTMVVPDGTTLVSHPDNGSPEVLLHSSEPVCTEAGEGPGQLPEVELEEVRKLQELVHRLEIQNESLRKRGVKTRSSNITGAAVNINQVQEIGDPQLELERRDDAAPRDFVSSSSSSCEEMSPLPSAIGFSHEEDELDEGQQALCVGFLTLSSGSDEGETPGHSQTPDSPSQGTNESETLADSDSGVDQNALDEVDVLDLEDGCADAEDDDSWLYVSPKKQLAEPGPDSPLKWCRQVLDHRSPETELACKSLISRLDQTSRWRNMYSSPSEAGSASSGPISPGYHKSTNKTLLTCGNAGVTGMHSTLSSQSSIDSELSTSDDSISMGYKLQDLTDVQIMARLQEESLRQDCASGSASVSRRSSTASQPSLRHGGTFSDQEFDTYSLEDEEDGFSSAPPLRHRFTPSPLGSPRCLSPSTSNHGQEYGSRLGTPRSRTPRRSLQGPSAELLKFAKSEEELRHSMPNLAPRTSLRSLEAVRNSRSMEANLQSSGNRMSHLSPSPSEAQTVTSNRLRSNGQSPLSLRTPIKAVIPVGSGGRQPGRGLPVIQTPGYANGGNYPAGRTSTGSTRPVVGRGQTVGPAPTRSRLSHPTKRSFGITRVSDESWKDGCY